MKETIVVTGGSRGIGAAIVERFAQEGYPIFLTFAQQQETAKNFSAYVEDKYRVKCQFAALNLEDETSILKFSQELRARRSPIKVLINNAGGTRYVPHNDFNESSPDLFTKMLQVNLVGHYSLISKIQDLIIDQGQIVNMASIAGFAATGSNVGYCAAKAGLISLTKNLAKALGPRLRVNAVAPGLTDTEMSQKAPREYINRVKEVSPLRDLVNPKDVAQVTYSLVTGMPFVTGQVIVVDGGYTL